MGDKRAEMFLGFVVNLGKCVLSSIKFKYIKIELKNICLISEQLKWNEHRGIKGCLNMLFWGLKIFKCVVSVPIQYSIAEFEVFNNHVLPVKH